MKKLLLLLFLLIPVSVSALVESYHPIYFITGFNKDTQTKYRISFKQGLIEPFETLFLAYTQDAKWNIYDRSSPFKEIAHNPEIFWEIDYPNNFIDVIRIIPYSHRSNGKDGQESRSMDRFFGEMQVSYMLPLFINVGLREKAGGFYAVSSHNKDIKRYIGYFETETFIELKKRHQYVGHERLYFKGEWTHKYGWFEAGLSFRIFTSKIQPNFYIQYYRGYAEFLEDYKQKTNAIRAGFIFN
jgi:phospholipase A1